MKHVKKTASVSPVIAMAMLSVLLASCASNNGASTSQVPPTPTPSEHTTAGKKYADGTYSAMGTYRAPSGTEDMNVSLTLKNGIITDASFQGDPRSKKSQLYQDLFSEGFKEQVVGKSIDSVSLDVVNGSSLTPIGFMNAVQKIKAQAQVS